MWLVIAHCNDLSGIWLYNQIKKQYDGEVEIIPAESIPYLLHWNCRIGNNEDVVSFTLPNGKTVDASRIKGVVNRMRNINVSLWRKMGYNEQMYVSQEHSGLYCSWLASLNCRVYNRPAPNGLSGAYRHEPEWRLLAAKAGLPTTAFETDSEEYAQYNEGGTVCKSALVFKDHVFGVEEQPELAEGCRQLARLAGLPFLGVQFAKNENDLLEFKTAEVIPELFDGGEKLVEAILHAN